jgi:hypothetical protein
LRRGDISLEELKPLGLFSSKGSDDILEGWVIGLADGEFCCQDWIVELLEEYKVCTLFLLLRWLWLISSTSGCIRKEFAFVSSSFDTDDMIDSTLLKYLPCYWGVEACRYHKAKLTPTAFQDRGFESLDDHNLRDLPCKTTEIFL